MEATFSDRDIITRVVCVSTSLHMNALPAPIHA